MNAKSRAARPFGGAWATGAVVFRGEIGAVDEAIRELEGRPDLKLIYVKTAAGRLRIVPEGDGWGDQP